MKKFILLSVTSLSIIFATGIYNQYQDRNKASYWLDRANKAVLNKDAKFIDFYNSSRYSLNVLSIEEGWKLYERYCNK
jgi:hypothetical protein